MQTRVLILGAGFGGLELATTLSESLGDRADVTVIDQSDSFVFGYAKLDVMFGRATPEAVRLPYSAIAKPGVRLYHKVEASAVAGLPVVGMVAGCEIAKHPPDRARVGLRADFQDFVVIDE